tara:strand:- start:15 stop:134 length:120 start_codon:yes stop_codon:yes gene_type:complete
MVKLDAVCKENRAWRLGGIITAAARLARIHFVDPNIGAA